MFADFTMIYEMGKDGKQIVKYKDNGNIKLVISSENGDIEQLIVDKKAYVAMSLGGKEKKYMDFDKISKGMSMFSSAMGDEPKYKQVMSNPNVKKLGGLTENYQGIPILLGRRELGKGIGLNRIGLGQEHT